MGVQTDWKWDRVQATIDSDDEGKYDLDVRLAGTEFRNGKLYFPKPAGPERYRSLSLDDNRRAQLCNTLNVPATFERNVRLDGKDGLADEMVQYGIEAISGRGEQNTKSLLRMRGREVRAVLSSQYQAISNKTVFDATRTIIDGGMIDHTILDFGLSDDWSYIKVLCNAVKKDDPSCPGVHGLRPGIIVRNSETGSQSLTISSFLYRDYCRNGMIFGKRDQKTVKVRHTGNITEAQVTALIARQVSRSIRGCERVVNQALVSRNHKFKDAKQSVKNLAVLTGMNKSVRGAVWVAFNKEPANNVWAVVNAMTRAAQNYSGMERVELETMAGDIIQGGREVWAQIAA